MSTRGGWYAAQAKANPDLFRVIFDFNRRPQHWVHSEVMNSLPHAPVINALTGSRHGSSHLAQWLDRELGLGGSSTCWDFSEARLRLALLGFSTLNRLARYAGAAACWPRVAATISKQEIRELKSALGEKAHVFALRRGRMIVPEHDTVPVPDSTSLGAHAIETGWRTIAAAMQTEHADLLRRFELKLLPEAARIVKAALAERSDSSSKGSAWNRLRKISPEVLSEGELKCFA